MTYGYNATFAFGNTVADIMDFAKDLLNSLTDKRESEEVSKYFQSLKITCMLMMIARRCADPLYSFPIHSVELL